MTNLDKYKDKILELCFNDNHIAVRKGKPYNCDTTDCYRCDLYSKTPQYNCHILLIRWLCEEYKEHEN